MFKKVFQFLKKRRKRSSKRPRISRLEKKMKEVDLYLKTHDENIGDLLKKYSDGANTPFYKDIWTMIGKLENMESTLLIEMRAIRERIGKVEEDLLPYTGAPVYQVRKKEERNPPPLKIEHQ